MRTVHMSILDISRGLAISKRAAEIRAQRELWPYLDQIVRGGRKRFYPLATLPEEVQRAVALYSNVAAAGPVMAPVVDDPGQSSSSGTFFREPIQPNSFGRRHPVSAAPTATGGLSTGGGRDLTVILSADLTDAQRLQRDARHGVLSALRRLQVESGCSQQAAITTLLTSAKVGALNPQLDKMLQLAVDRRGQGDRRYPSGRTLKRWLVAADLAPRTSPKQMTAPPWAQHFLAIYQQPEKPALTDAYRQFCATLADDNRPSIHQVRRMLHKIGAVSLQHGRMGARELKNLKPFIRRDFSHLEPNDIWSADGHTFDAEVQHPFHGRPFRPEITVFVDIATGRARWWRACGRVQHQ